MLLLLISLNIQKKLKPQDNPDNQDPNLKDQNQDHPAKHQKLEEKDQLLVILLKDQNLNHQLNKENQLRPPLNPTKDHLDNNNKNQPNPDNQANLPEDLNQNHLPLTKDQLQITTKNKPHQERVLPQKTDLNQNKEIPANQLIKLKLQNNKDNNQRANQEDKLANPNHKKELKPQREEKLDILKNLLANPEDNQVNLLKEKLQNNNNKQLNNNNNNITLKNPLINQEDNQVEVLKNQRKTPKETNLLKRKLLKPRKVLKNLLKNNQKPQKLIKPKDQFNHNNQKMLTKNKLPNQKVNNIELIALEMSF
jgi:hypothetical protein